MNYQIICVCGHRFFITEQQVAGHVTCPACGRALIPVVAPQEKSGGKAAETTATAEGADTLPDGANPEPAIATSAEATKRCPFCGEVILAIAKKCKHCGEFLDRSPPGTTGTPAVAGTPASAASSAAAPAPLTPSTTDDAPVFTMSVSQWDNFWKYLVCLTIAVLVPAGLIYFKAPREYQSIGIPATLALMFFVAWFFYLSTRSARCVIRPLRIETEVGILSKEATAVELFRILDMKLDQGILGRLLGIGTIRITSSDAITPELILYQIPRARQVYKYLQAQVPAAARQRRAMYVER